MIKRKRQFSHALQTTFFLLLISPVLLSASGKLDSLIRAAELQPASERKVLAYEAICDSLYYLAPDSALIYARKGVRVAEKIDFARGKAVSTSWMGYLFDASFNMIDSAIHYYLISRDAYASLGMKIKEIDQEINMGAAYTYGSQYGKAIEVLMLSLEKAKKIKALQLQSELLNNLGVAHRLMQDEEGAIKVYRKAITIQQQLNDTSLLANTYRNLGVALSKSSQGQIALEALRESRRLYTQLKDENNIAALNVTIAMAHYDLGNKSEAALFIDSIFSPEHKTLLDNEDLTKYLLFKGSFDLEKEQYRNALQSFEEGYRLIEGTDRIELIAEYSKGMATAHARLGQFENSYAHLLRYNRSRDTLNQQYRLTLEEEMRAKFDTKQKEQEIEKQKIILSQKKREQQLLLALSSALGVLLLISFLLARTNIRNNRVLRQKNDIIKLALEQKETLLKEIHHRVKNNLQIIVSLLNLQASRIQDKNALAAISEGKNRVKSMALIHQNLYQDEELVSINARDYVEKLTDNLLSTYQITQRKVKVHKAIQDMQIDVDTIIPLGLILNELITNALKYAFSIQDQGELHIQLKEDGNELQLQVADNGKGMPEDFEISKTNSMGFKIIKSFARKLKATLYVTGTSGTCVTLRIPARPQEIRVVGS